MNNIDISEQLLQEELKKTKRIKTEGVVITKKNAKLVILFVFITLPILAYYAVNDSQSQAVLNKLNAQVDELISAEEVMGINNKMVLTPVKYDIGKAMGDKTDDCNGLIMSIGDVVFCQSASI